MSFEVNGAVSQSASLLQEPNAYVFNVSSNVHERQPLHPRTLDSLRPEPVIAPTSVARGGLPTLSKCNYSSRDDGRPRGLYGRSAAARLAPTQLKATWDDRQQFLCETYVRSWENRAVDDMVPILKGD